MKQHYVAGSNVPGFFWGTDFYPDSTNPDDTDLSLTKDIIHIQFRLGENGTIQTVEATKVSRTIDGVSHAGLLVSAANMAAKLTVADRNWHWRFQVDLLGDNKPCLSEWKQFTVWE
jgi:hypothetical protein